MEEKKCVKRDFKKEERALYQPGTEPRILDVPDLLFLMVDGTGDPNTSAAYQEAIEMLYGLSYEIKMSPKKGAAPQGYYDYVVPPLEGLWTTKEAPQDDHILNKSQFSWTSLIRQPEFVTQKVLDAAKERLAKKKPELDLSKVRLEQYREGRCCQALHIGSFDSEPDTIRQIGRYLTEAGYEADIKGERRHHEIYLTDARKTEPAKRKTVIRIPICRSAGSR